jgi:hypothetical protein
VVKFLSLTLTLALAWSVLASHGRQPPEQTVTSRPTQIAEDGYTSSETCRACHPDQYASWRGSYHRTMTQVAAPGAVLADFDGATVADVHGRPMTLATRDNRYWASFDDPDWDGRGGAPPRIDREVVMITGSHHQQIYWYATGQNRLLGQLPGAYLVQERRWIPRRMAVLHPPGDPVFSETGHWNSVCIACHATHGKPRSSSPLGSEPLASQVVDSTTVEHGIACESCHGPAAAHVAANRTPLRRYGLHLSGAADPTIVQPTRLDPRKSAQVCGQCHGIWEFYDGAGERRANTAGLPFRPGDELADTRFVAQPTRNGDSPTMRALVAEDTGFVRDSFWPDGTVRVSGREYNGLLESPCFVRATDQARTLTCASCHTLHKTADDQRPLAAWADDQLGPRMETNEACTQCHREIAVDLSRHTHHPERSQGSACYNCHMPYTTYGLLKTIRSHTVGSPSVAETASVGRPNACNLCHVDKTLRWTSDALERWYGHQRAALTADQERVSSMALMALEGDAGQRVIAAEAFGWPPAQQASATDWMAPFLAQLLDDGYDAVRFSAGRSLGRLPGFEQFQFDFVAGPQARRRSQLQVMRRWDDVRGAAKPAPENAVLLASDGSLMVNEMLRLIRQRNHRRMLLRE